MTRLGKWLPFLALQDAQGWNCGPDILPPPRLCSPARPPDSYSNNAVFRLLSARIDALHPIQPIVCALAIALLFALNVCIALEPVYSMIAILIYAIVLASLLSTRNLPSDGLVRLVGDQPIRDLMATRVTVQDWSWGIWALVNPRRLLQVQVRCIDWLVVYSLIVHVVAIHRLNATHYVFTSGVALCLVYVRGTRPLPLVWILWGLKSARVALARKWAPQSFFRLWVGFMSVRLALTVAAILGIGGLVFAVTAIVSHPPMQAAAMPVMAGLRRSTASLLATWPAAVLVAWVLGWIATRALRWAESRWLRAIERQIAGMQELLRM